MKEQMVYEKIERYEEICGVELHVSAEIDAQYDSLTVIIEAFGVDAHYDFEVCCSIYNEQGELLDLECSEEPIVLDEFNGIDSRELYFDLSIYEGERLGKIVVFPLRL